MRRQIYFDVKYLLLNLQANQETYVSLSLLSSDECLHAVLSGIFDNERKGGRSVNFKTPVHHHFFFSFIRRDIVFIPEGKSCGNVSLLKCDIMIRTVITLLVSFLCISIYAQDTNTDKKVEITGKVTNASAVEIEGAVIVATGVGGVAGATVTDSTGKFTVSVNCCDSLAVEISHLQYESHTVVMSAISAPVDLGSIILAEKKETIQEAVVTGSFIKMRGTDMLVDVKGNPDAKGKNALQFLNTLPGINGLHIYGQGLSKVYINDRELKLPNDQLYSYVASLKAEDVQSIQIVTRKGAKYEAGHKGGVIRIRMSKSDNKRLSGTLSVPVSVNTYDGAITTDIPFMLNYTNGKLSSYTFASFHYMQNENTNSRQIYENREEWSKSDRTFMSMMLDQSLVYDI